MLEVIMGSNLKTYLIDRQYNFREVSHLFSTDPVPFLPKPKQERTLIVNLFDGELIDDRDWRGTS